MKRAVIITSYLDKPMDIPELLREEDTIICLDGGYDIAIRQGVRPDILLGDFDSIEAQIPDEGDIQVLKYPPEKDYSDLELAFRLLDPRDYPQILIVGGIGGRQDQTAINMHLITRYSRPVIKGAVAFPDPEAGPEDSSIPFSRIDILDSMNHCFAVHGANIRCCAAGLGSDPDIIPGSEDLPDDSSHLPGEIDPDAPDNAVDGLGPDEPGTAEEDTPATTVQIPREEECYLSLVPMTDFCEGVSLTGVKYPLDNATLRRGSSLSISNEFNDDAATLSIQGGSLLVVISHK